VDLKPGLRLRSAADTTEVIVVRAPQAPVELLCGGHPMLEAGAPSNESLGVKPGFDQGCQLGKRYAHEASGLEMLCTKAGQSALSAGDEVLLVKGAKPLPSSD
jgi:hypothetical protein